MKQLPSQTISRFFFLSDVFGIVEKTTSMSGKGGWEADAAAKACSQQKTPPNLTRNKHVIMNRWGQSHDLVLGNHACAHGHVACAHVRCMYVHLDDVDSAPFSCTRAVECIHVALFLPFHLGFYPLIGHWTCPLLFLPLSIAVAC